MLDLSPQISEVMGASRRLTRFTSMCLCLLLLSLAQHLGRKSFFFFSRHHSQFPLCLDSLPLDDCPRAARCLAQDTRRRALSQPVSVPPGRARGSSRERPCWLRHRQLALVSCQEIDLPRARKIESIT